MRKFAACFFLIPVLLAMSAAGSDQRPNSPAPSLKPSSGDALQARRAAVAELIARGRSSAPRALELLDSPEAGDRAAGIHVLASIRETAATPRIVRTLAADGDDGVRVQAAAALGALGSADGVDALIRAADGDTSRDVRVRAIAALGSIDSARVTAPIRRFVQSARSDVEFQAAAVAAGQRRIAALEPDLIAACRDVDRGEHARGAAAIALGLLGSPTRARRSSGS